jgi:hypothetical protein
VIFVATTLLVFFPQLWIWKRTYGEWLAMPMGPHYMRWSEPHIDGVLFGAAAGLLTFTPLMYAGVLGLLGGVVARKTRLLALSALVVFAGFVYVNACVWDWWAAATYGARRFTAVVPLLGVGTALSAHWLMRRAERRPRRFAGQVLALGVGLFAIYHYAAMWSTAQGRLAQERDQRADFYFRAIVAEASDGVEEAVGNPFAWPASIPFAIQYDAHPRRYDLARGIGVFYQEFETARVRGRDEWDRLRPARGRQMDYVVDGFDEDPRPVMGRSAAVTNDEHARILVPLFADDVSAVEITWVAALPGGTPPNVRRQGAARAAIFWNGHPLAQADVPAEWTTLSVEMPADIPRVGVNEMELELADGPIAIEVMRFRQAPIPDDPNRMRDWYDIHRGGIVD